MKSSTSVRLNTKISNRKWVGIDIGILSTRLVQDTLKIRYQLRSKEYYAINGIPVSIEGAIKLFNQDPFQFQYWALEALGGFCSNKKTVDRGIDGRIYFHVEGKSLSSMVLSVKGGKHINPTDIRDLKGTMQREKEIKALKKESKESKTIFGNI